MIHVKSSPVVDFSPTAALIVGFDRNREGFVPWQPDSENIRLNRRELGPTGRCFRRNGGRKTEDIIVFRQSESFVEIPLEAWNWPFCEETRVFRKDDRVRLLFAVTERHQQDRTNDTGNTAGGSRIPTRSEPSLSSILGFPFILRRA